MALRDTLPVSLRGIAHDGLIHATFEDAMIPEFIFPASATPRPWQADMGDTVFFNRTGLLTPQEDFLDGNDPNPDNYGLERYSMTMHQYGNSVDTNLLGSSISIQSKFLLDQQKLGINGGQSLNRITRKKLYEAYDGGRTFVSPGGVASTTIAVDSVLGFDTVLVGGFPTPVSGAAPLPVTISGVGVNVIAVDKVGNTLTIDSAVATVTGDPVVAATAPVSLRPNGKDTAFNLAAGDTITFGLFADAVARLRDQSVPTVGGYYIAHIDPITERQLFNDQSFLDAFASREASPVFGSLSIGRFAGVDFVRNNEVPKRTIGGLTVRKPIVMGSDALVAGPYEDMANLLAELNGVPTGSVELMDAGVGVGMEVAHIIRPPQDRLQQVVSSSWSWIGDFACPTDSISGDETLYKRAIVIEHAG